MPSKVRILLLPPPGLKSLQLSLYAKKTAWGPTWRGWLLLFLLAGGFTVIGGRHAHSFLAVSEPVSANVLVIECWAPDYVLKQAITEFERGKYDFLCAAGGPLEKGSLITGYQSTVELTCASLKALHFPGEKLIEAPALSAWRHRTYGSAQAAKAKLRSLGIQIKGLNVFTVGTHARRTLIVYRKVFGAKDLVGVISCPSEDYDAARWWRPRYRACSSTCNEPI